MPLCPATTPIRLNHTGVGRNVAVASSRSAVCWIGARLCSVCADRNPGEVHHIKIVATITAAAKVTLSDGRSLEGLALTPVLLSSFVLKRLLQDAAPQSGKIDEAVITVPAWFGDLSRGATLDAARQLTFTDQSASLKGQIQYWRNQLSTIRWLRKMNEQRRRHAKTR